MNLYGFYKTARNGNLKMIIDNDYKTKKAMQEDIRRNGYRCIVVLNEDEIKNYENLSTEKIKFNLDILHMIKDYVICNF